MHKPSTVQCAIVVSLLTLPLVYALSFGPACWIQSRTSFKASEKLYLRVYQPVGWVDQHGPEFLRRAIWQYAELECEAIPIILPTSSGDWRMRLRNDNGIRYIMRL